MQKTIEEYDRELEALQQRFQRLHGEIEQLKMERSFELARLAKEKARTEPIGSVQLSQWNDCGFVNDFSKELA